MGGDFCELCGIRETEIDLPFGPFVPGISHDGERVCWACFKNYAGRGRAVAAFMDEFLNVECRMEVLTKDALNAGFVDLAFLAEAIGSHAARVAQALSLTLPDDRGEGGNC